MCSAEEWSRINESAFMPRTLSGSYRAYHVHSIAYRQYPLCVKPKASASEGRIFMQPNFCAVEFLCRRTFVPPNFCAAELLCRRSFVPTNFCADELLCRQILFASKLNHCTKFYKVQQRVGHASHEKWRNSVTHNAKPIQWGFGLNMRPIVRSIIQRHPSWEILRVDIDCRFIVWALWGILCWEFCLRYWKYYGESIVSLKSKPLT